MATSEDAPHLRSMRGRIGAYESWARTADRSARTWPARKAAMDKFEREVDPEGKLTIQERQARRVGTQGLYATAGTEDSFESWDWQRCATSRTRFLA
jgi:hypothetical protein